jgi:hypothetical protein
MCLLIGANKQINVPLSLYRSVVYCKFNKSIDIYQHQETKKPESKIQAFQIYFNYIYALTKF